MRACMHAYIHTYVIYIHMHIPVVPGTRYSAATVSCTFCRQLSQIEARNGRNKKNLLRRCWKPLYPEKKRQGFAPQSAFTCEFMRS